MKDNYVNEIISVMRHESQAVGKEAADMGSVWLMVASGWKGEGSEEYAVKLSMLAGEIESVHREIDNLLDMIG